MSDIGGRLVQLPNGDWIDPRQIRGVCADAVVNRQTNEVGPAVIIVQYGGREIYWRVASDEDAKRERDETVRRLGMVGATATDGVVEGQKQALEEIHGWLRHMQSQSNMHSLWRAAVSEVELHVLSAIERLDRGEPLTSTSEVDSGNVQKRTGPLTLADELDDLAENRDLIDCACEEVESTLANLRDDGARVSSARCGLVIMTPFGQDSSVIRMYVDEALRIALRRIAHQIRLEAK